MSAILSQIYPFVATVHSSDIHPQRASGTDPRDVRPATWSTAGGFFDIDGASVHVTMTALDSFGREIASADAEIAPSSSPFPLCLSVSAPGIAAIRISPTVGVPGRLLLDDFFFVEEPGAPTYTDVVEITSPTDLTRTSRSVTISGRFSTNRPPAWSTSNWPEVARPSGGGWPRRSTVAAAWSHCWVFALPLVRIRRAYFRSPSPYPGYRCHPVRTPGLPSSPTRLFCCIHPVGFMRKTRSLSSTSRRRPLHRQQYLRPLRST